VDGNRARVVRIWLLALFAAAAAAAPAAATPTSGPTTAVSLGDSFISGEAGRWLGNSTVATGDRAGTDRAWTGSGYDPTRIYGATDANGCHRSDVAEIRSAPLFISSKVNLACSGATTANIFQTRSGGQAQKGEPPQGEKLRYVAQVARVQLIVLSIGGNDLGFADIITNCALRYTSKTGPCNATEQANVNARWGAAFAGVAKAIDEVRAVMAERGYARSQYRFVLQSYPSPVPRASEARYPELGVGRATIGGCPFYDVDLNWARDSLVNQIANGLRYVAAHRGVEFLDLRNALQGREVCATASRQATLTSPPDGASSEWARFLTQNLVQGEVQETLHPNAYAQQALGRCLAFHFHAGRGDGVCRNTPGQGPQGMTYSRL
jgi:GDSL-like lipase/acylhydrolase family protein